MDFIYGKKVNVKKIAIFETGSDFAAINFDVLKKNNGKCFDRFKNKRKNLVSKFVHVCKNSTIRRVPIILHSPLSTNLTK